MPKLKSNRAAKKRFKKLGTGKFKRGRPFSRHILTSKSRKRKRAFRRGALVHPANIKELGRLMPYG